MSLQENQVSIFQRLHHNDSMQRIKFLENSYSEKASENESEASPQSSQTSSPQNRHKRVSFDLSPYYSTSAQGGFSEAISHLEDSNKSFRRLSECNFRREEPQGILKNQSKFGSMEEVKLLSSPKNKVEKMRENKHKEDSGSKSAKSSRLSRSRNHPRESLRIRKHPDH